MSEKSATSFKELVSAMRTSEKKFWETRSKYALRQSIELEKRVDDIIMKAGSSEVPDNDNGKFFLAVAQLRVNTKEYFAEKKKSDADKEKINALFADIKRDESKIDKAITLWRDEQAIKEGKLLVWHVMERYPRGEAHPVFSSTDEQEAKIYLNDYFRKPTCPGCMYFLCKEYKERAKLSPNQQQ